MGIGAFYQERHRLGVFDILLWIVSASTTILAEFTYDEGVLFFAQLVLVH